jgi:hypothetical protein
MKVRSIESRYSRARVIATLVSAVLLASPMACNFGLGGAYFGIADAGVCAIGEANGDAATAIGDAAIGDAAIGDAARDGDGDVVVDAASACPLPNLFKNADFENSTINGWNIQYARTFSALPEAAHTGGFGARICFGQPGQFGNRIAELTQDFSGRSPPLANAKYHLHFYARSNSDLAGTSFTPKVGDQVVSTANPSPVWDCKELNSTYLVPDSVGFQTFNDKNPFDGCMDVDDFVFIQLPDDGGGLPPGCGCP